MHGSPEQPVSQDVAIQHALEARNNVNTVISASLMIEREIEAIINNYLHPEEPASEQKLFVAAYVLGSDLPFAAKRRMVVALAKSKQWLDKKEAQAFDDLIIKIGKFRNAMAHGSVIERGQSTVLTYFESEPREFVLTDAFWDGVVETFTAAIQGVERLKAKAKPV
jgi:hypothetical protein